MTIFQNFLGRARQFYPDLKIQYKDQSLLMKIINKVLFFTKDFNTYTTTIGSTIYYPSSTFIKNNPATAAVILMHELSHLYNSKKNGFILSGLAYLFPQILALLSIPLFIIFGWKLALLSLFFLLPLPAYFRMQEEKQAYTISLYVLYKLNQLQNFNTKLEPIKDNFVKEFSGPDYYFVWYLPGIQGWFDRALEDIKKGEKPKYDAGLIEMIDKILED